MPRSDRQLLEAYQQGETTAFEILVRRHGGPLLGYLTRLCGNRDRAEDCFQETFKRMAEKADKIQGDSLKGWLFRVGSNVAMDGFRQQKKGPTALAHEPIDENQPVDAVMQDERIAQVRTAVNSLPERQKATLLLAYYQKLSYAQVAEALGCSVGTVKTQMSRALKTLAQKLPDPG